MPQDAFSRHFSCVSDLRENPQDRTSMEGTYTTVIHMERGERKNLSRDGKKEKCDRKCGRVVSLPPGTLSGIFP